MGLCRDSDYDRASCGVFSSHVLDAELWHGICTSECVSLNFILFKDRLREHRGRQKRLLGNCLHIRYV